MVNVYAYSNNGNYIVIKINYTLMFTKLSFEVGYKHKSKYIYFETSKTRVIKHTDCSYKLLF